VSAAGSVAIVVNGERRELAPGTRLVDFLAGEGVDVRRIAVERNRHVVPRAEHGEVVVADGDAFEIVHFVGGG
jgi:thiamine biosynthesis protein ThiS